MTIHPWSVLSGIAKSLNWNWKIKIIELCIEGCGEGDLKCLSEKRKPHDKSQITVISTNAKEKSISFLTGQEKSRKFKFCFSNYPKQSSIQNIFTRVPWNLESVPIFSLTTKHLIKTSVSTFFYELWWGLKICNYYLQQPK